MMSSDSSTMAMKQATLDGEAYEIPELECRLHGGICGNSAVYVAELAGNEYVDGGEVAVCEPCLEEFLEGGVEDYHTLTDQEVLGRV